MTSKEFLRRSKYYQSLAYAKFLFYSGTNVSSIYKYTLVQYDGSVIESYFKDMDSLIASNSLHQFQSLWIDSYPKSQFMIDFGYFLAFYNRCSEYQKKLIKNDSVLNFLLEDDNKE